MATSDPRGTKTCVIYDIDGTIAENGQPVTKEMLDFIQEVRKRVPVAVVGGSMMLRVYDKLGQDALEKFDYIFAENGLVAYKGGKLLAEQSIIDKLSNEKINELINWVLDYLSKLDLPVKRGTFVDFRTGLINISPAGRFLRKEDRAIWVKYDEEHQVRKTMVEKLRQKVDGWGLEIVIGGQMGFDIFPQGWDKTFCLQYLDEYEEIHFFGDKTELGGNDHAICNHPRTIGHPITGPAETRRISEELFLK